MPSRNIYKPYIGNSYYHIYNRGINKAAIFLDKQDFTVFLSLLKRYLGKDIEKMANRQAHPNYYGKVELLAFCLMPNHFHLFIYQSSPEAIKNLMKSLGVAYGMYFNKKYKRVGPVFQQRYKAVLIDNDGQLLHISRYIHMNPTDYSDYLWSSLPYYLGKRSASWVRPKRVLELFKDSSYIDFLDEYKTQRKELAAFKDQLADA